MVGIPASLERVGPMFGGAKRNWEVQGPLTLQGIVGGKLHMEVGRLPGGREGFKTGGLQFSSSHSARTYSMT